MVQKKVMLLIVLVIVVLTFSYGEELRGSCTSEVSPKMEKLNLDGITLLLDLIDTIFEKNPDISSTIPQLKDMDETGRMHILDEMKRRNSEDPEINHKLDDLLSTSAYELYYAQFRNVNPSLHREIFYALPYRAIKSPAGIADNLLELCHNRDAVESWIEKVISKIDLNRSHTVALRWLPEGEYSIPTTYFIYDGNGDAFARSGSVCFDLYGTLLSNRPRERRFQNLDEIDVDDTEEILAHEFHHVYAAPYLYPPGRTHDTWQDMWMDSITRRLVSEGVGMRCNPVEGFKQDIMEDRGTVAFWIDQLNDTFTLLKAGTSAESEFKAWYNNTYQETARTLLKNYVQSHYPDSDAEKMIREHVADRPTFIYTLGWWMISKISDHGKNRDKVIQLLSQPEMLFPLYNESLGEREMDLKVISAQ